MKQLVIDDFLCMIILISSQVVAQRDSFELPKIN